MKFILLALFLVGALATDLPVDFNDPRCLDVTYGCQDLHTARACGIVLDCIDDYWTTIGVPEEKNEICDICKEMVKEARDQLLSNMTQEELKEVFEGSCKLLPIKAVQNACIKLVDEFIPELVEMLASRMDPTQVCTVAGLCLSDGKIVKSTCEKCLNVSVGVKKMFSIIPQDLFKNTIVNQCITKYEGLKDECQALFGTDWDKIYEYLNNLTPRGACAQLSLCRGEFQPFLKGVGDNMTCEFCENLIRYLQNILQSKSLKEEIRSALNNMCSDFGQLKNECQSLVDQYFDEAYDMLVQELNPLKVCTTFGLCDGGKCKQRPVEEFLPIHNFEPVPQAPNEVETGPRDDLECSVCKKVINYVKDTVKDPKNEEKVREALDKVCTLLPASMTSKCEEFVNTYIDLVIFLLAQEMDSDKICEYIGLCPPSTPTRENSSTLECYLCKKVINQLKNMVTDPTSEAKIRQSLDTVCQYLPNRYTTKCVNMVNTYTDMIVRLLVQQLDTDVICHILSLCPSQVDTQPEELGPADECELCQMAVDEMENLLQNNNIDKDITVLVEKVCGILPRRYENRCRLVIEDYGPYILQMLAQLADSQQICAGIDLCPSQAPLGSSRCSWGPAFWCASRENAENCGAVKHCQEKVWNKKKHPALLGSKKCTWGPAYWCKSRENARACKAEAHCETKVWNRRQ